MAFKELNKEDFVGSVEISVGTFDKNFKIMVNETAEHYRKRLLGVSLYTKIKNLDPLTPKYTTLLEGGTFTPLYCSTEEFLDGFDKLILDLCYYNWVKNTHRSTPTGMRKSETENSTNNPRVTIQMAATRFNVANDRWIQCEKFIDSCNGTHIEVLGVTGSDVIVKDLLFLEEGDQVISNDGNQFEVINIHTLTNTVTLNLAPNPNLKYLAYSPFPSFGYGRLGVILM